MKIAEQDLKIAHSRYREEKARLKEQEASLAEGKKLYQQGYISAKELEKRKASYEALRHRISTFAEVIEVQKQKIQLLQNELQKTVIRAPFSGMILHKMVEVGAIIAPQDKGLFVLIDRSQMVAAANIDQKYAARVAIGQKTSLVLTSYPDQIYHGIVSRIFPEIESGKDLIRVEAKIATIDPKMLPNMSTTITFIKEGSKAKEMLVPVTAIQKQNGQNYLWVVEHGKLQRRYVETTAISSKQLVVEKGLAAGDLIVISPLEGLQPNQEVKTVTSK